LNDISHAVIGAAIEVHRHLGPGLLESIYEEALLAELDLRAVPAQRQIEVPILYKDRRLAGRLRLDLLVAEQVIVEVKSVESLARIHEAQLLSYLRLTDLQLGLLLNFNTRRLLDGVQRLVRRI
jgi:GxxExxY protein